MTEVLTIGTFKHSISGYNRGCRCDTCTLAKSIKRKQYQSESAKLNAARRAKYARMTPEAKALKSEYDKVYRQLNADKLKQYDRTSHLKKIFNMTEAEYNTILERQNGVCAICLKSSGMRHLAVDHDHKCCPGKKSCGKCIRGLLCQKCNGYLGRIDENPTNLVSYLQKGGL